MSTEETEIMIPRKRNTILASAAAYTSPGYPWYQSMMSGYYGNGTGMMRGTSSGSHGWMMSQAGYQWMTGSGTALPGWMAGAPSRPP